MFGNDDAHVRRTCGFVSGVVPAKPFRGAPYSGLPMIMVCMTPRSGSHYFGSLLRDNGLGLAHEHFRYTGGQIEETVAEHGLTSFEDFVRHVIDSNTAPGPVFSSKVDWMQFMPLYYLGAYDHYLSAARYIYLSRRDRLNQAISRYIATESRYFHTTYSEHRQAVADVCYSYEGIEAHLEHLLKMETVWENFFLSENIRPLRIFYEDLATGAEAVMKSVFAYLGRPEPDKIVVKTEYGKVATAKNQEYRERFLSDRRAGRQALTRTFEAASGH